MDNMTESSLAELVEDPLVGLVMKSDGVDCRSVELLFERVGRGWARGVEPPQPCLTKRKSDPCTTR